MAGAGGAHARIRAVGTRALARLGLSAAISVLPVKTNVFISFAKALRVSAERIFSRRLKSYKFHHLHFLLEGKDKKIDGKNKPPTRAFIELGFGRQEKTKAFGSN